MKTMRFTLLEVVVAMAILSVSLVIMLQLLIAAQGRMGKSYDKWRETHVMMQAAEYFLLQKGEDPGGIPDQFFPYRDYTVYCSYADAEGLPEELTGQEGQLPLRSCVIELTRMSDRKIVDKLVVDRISYETTVQGE